MDIKIVVNCALTLHRHGYVDLSCKLLMEMNHPWLTFLAAFMLYSSKRRTGEWAFIFSQMEPSEFERLLKLYETCYERNFDLIRAAVKKEKKTQCNYQVAQRDEK